MNITIGKPLTYNGVNRIAVRADVKKYGFDQTVLEIVKTAKGWDVIQPAKSAIWTTSGNVISPAKSVKYYAVNLPLKIAKQTAIDLINSGLLEE